MELIDAVSALSGTAGREGLRPFVFYLKCVFRNSSTAGYPVTSYKPQSPINFASGSMPACKTGISAETHRILDSKSRATGKYFYVWLDAPIGPIASHENFCQRSGEAFDTYWQPGHETELYHFIGKDIINFHGLFWPAMLSSAGLRLPTAIYAHGFLTVDGTKMSKSRGTFIMATTYTRSFESRVSSLLLCRQTQCWRRRYRLKPRGLRTTSEFGRRR